MANEITDTREGTFDCRQFRAEWNGSWLYFNPHDDHLSIDQETVQRFARWLIAMVQP